MLQRHQNEKNCQQSTFLARIIYSLSLSFFFFRIRSFFAPLFGAWFPSLCLGRQGIVFPQNKPIRQPFPLRTRKCPFDFPSRKLCLFLSLFRRASFALFSFLAEDIYILYILLLLSSFGDPRARVEKSSSGRRSVFLETLSARVYLP